MRDYILSLDYYELLALHKALLEAKFHTKPDNEEISGSPLVANTCIQVRDLLLQSEKAAQWEDWFQLKNRRDYRATAIMRMSKDRRWEKASDEERKRIAGDYLAPFLCGETELYETVEAVNRMRTKKVTVLPYDEGWKSAFEAIRQELEQVLEDLILGIEHVGSTSVEGLSAKPCIDIDVIILDYSVFEAVVWRLKTIGYIHEGDLGIRDREAFCYTDKPHLMKHHLYVCPRDSEELHRHLTFRDFLRSNPEAARKYGQVKETAARLFPEDIEKYMEYKAPCIGELYEQCGLK